MRVRSDRKPGLDVGVTLPVSLAWLLFWWPQLVGERLLFVRDLSLFAAPGKQYWLQRLMAGELPQWTSQVSGGLPFLADPANQALYPLNLLMLSSADLMVALTRFVLVHLLIGMLGVAGMVRAQNGSRLAAVFAAGLYGFSGYAVSITDNITYIGGLAWVPVALAGWLYARRAGGGGGLVVAALAVAAAVLAGDVLGAAVACAVMVLLALGADGRDGDDGAATVAARLSALLLVLVLAVLLAAVQILPASAMFADSARAGGLGLAQQTEWSFPPARTLEFVQPYFFGSLYPMFDFLAPGLYRTMGVPWVQSVYVGLLPVALALAGIVAAPRRALLWLLLGVASLLLAFGGNAPWYGWISEHLPALATQRYPEKFILWTTLAIVLLAARGLDTLRNTSGLFAHLAGASAFSRATLTLAILSVQFFLLLDWPARAWVWSHAQRTSPYWSVFTAEPITHLQGLLLHSLPIALALALLLWFPARAYRALALTLVLVSLADLALLHRLSVPVVPRQLASTEAPAALALLRAQGGETARIYFDDEVPGNNVSYRDGRLAARVLAALGNEGDPYARGYLVVYAMLFHQERLATQFGTRLGVSYLNGRYSPLQPASHLGLETALADGAADRLLAATGTRFVVTAIEPRNPVLEVAGLSEVARDDEFNLRLLAVREPQPFARMASSVREVVAGDSYDTLAALQRQAPAAALIETPDGLPGGPAVAPGASVARWRRASPERMEFDIEGATGAGLLVITESWAPGWRASVDGVETAVRRADLRLLGVTVPAGGRHVVLAYHTPRLFPGAVLSLLGVLLGIVLLRRRAPR